MGCFIDVTAMIILVLPVMIPIVTAIGFSKIAFGVIFILAAVMGVATPPFGLGLYIGSEISRLDFNTTVRSVLPYGIPLGVVIILMVLWPRIVTFLPDMLM
jgi:TRAP-type C4-dicarboxylate transport system permease large subunit